MRYLTNHEVAEIYRVSERTVGNWIDYAIDEKVDLQLVHEDEKEYILNTNHNHVILTDLSYKSRKYKSKKLKKIIKPNQDFYRLFNAEQIIELVNSLESYKEIPHKYTYFDRGATYLDKYVQKLAQEKSPNALTNTTQLLEKNLEYILSLVSKYTKVNLVDLGPGNALPVKNFIGQLLSRNLLNKYLIIDYSEDMAKIAKDNIKMWYGKEVEVEDEYMDINYRTFQRHLFINSHKNNKHESYANIIMLLGDTPANQRLMHLPFIMVNSSMNATSDIFLYTEKLDTPRSRMYFDFAVEDVQSKISELDSLIPELLNISREYYDVENVFDEVEKTRFIKLVLKYDVEIKFSIYDTVKSVSMFRGDKVIIWRGKHQSYNEVMNMMDSTGFNVLHTSRSLDEEQLLVISKVKSV